MPQFPGLNGEGEVFCDRRGVDLAGTGELELATWEDCVGKAESVPASLSCSADHELQSGEERRVVNLMLWLSGNTSALNREL